MESLGGEGLRFGAVPGWAPCACVFGLLRPGTVPPGLVALILKTSFAAPKKTSRIATAASSRTTSSPLKSSISTRYRFGS